jgi:ABC-2 type transport system permease protein
MIGATIWGGVKGVDVPWVLLVYYTGLLMSLTWCFLGIGMLISTVTRSSDVAQGTAFVVWLTLLLFIDLILLGVMIQEHLPPESAVAIALANPLQVFRIATMLLLDPQLVMLGPTAYVVLDHFGQTGFIIYAILYPVALGSAAAGLGFYLFRRSDLP